MAHFEENPINVIREMGVVECEVKTKGVPPTTHQKCPSVHSPTNKRTLLHPPSHITPLHPPSLYTPHHPHPLLQNPTTPVWMV